MTAHALNSSGGQCMVGQRVSFGAGLRGDCPTACRCRRAIELRRTLEPRCLRHALPKGPGSHRRGLLPTRNQLGSSFPLPTRTASLRRAGTCSSERLSKRHAGALASPIVADPGESLTPREVQHAQTRYSIAGGEPGEYRLVFEPSGFSSPKAPAPARTSGSVGGIVEVILANDAEERLRSRRRRHPIRIAIGAIFTPPCASIVPAPHSSFRVSGGVSFLRSPTPACTPHRCDSSTAWQAASTETTTPPLAWSDSSLPSDQPACPSKRRPAASACRGAPYPPSSRAGHYVKGRRASTHYAETAEPDP